MVMSVCPLVVMVMSIWLKKENWRRKIAGDWFYGNMPKKVLKRGFKKIPRIKLTMKDLVGFLVISRLKRFAYFNRCGRWDGIFHSMLSSIRVNFLDFYSIPRHASANFTTLAKNPEDSRVRKQAGYLELVFGRLKEYKNVDCE